MAELLITHRINFSQNRKNEIKNTYYIQQRHGRKFCEKYLFEMDKWGIYLPLGGSNANQIDNIVINVTS